MPSIPQPAAGQDRPWPAEIELLLACARPRLEAADLDRAETAIRRRVDWERLLTLGQVHGLLPLLHRHVASGAVSMPPAPRAALRSQALANTHRSLALTGELQALLRLLADEGIPVVPLKGPLLAEQLYGSVSLRRSGDLDLLVRGSDLPRVQRLLEARGYQFEARGGAQEDEIARRTSHHVSAIDAETKIRIELHHCLLRPRGRPRWEFDIIERRLQTMAWMGLSVSVLSPEDLLVYLCEHGAEHSWSRLEWLASVAELLRGGHLRDWAAATAWAQSLGAARRVRAARLLAAGLLGADAGVPAVGRDRSALTANRVVLRRLRREPLRTIESPGERFAYLWLTEVTTRARLQRGFALMAPSAADAQSLPLPKALSPLYWALRPVRLLARHLKQGW